MTSNDLRDRDDPDSKVFQRCDGSPPDDIGRRSRTADSQPNDGGGDAGEDNGKAVAEELVERMMGVDLTAIPTIGPEIVQPIASGIGPDLKVFPTAGHFCSWFGLSSETNISGGRKMPNWAGVPTRTELGGPCGWLR